MFHDDKEKVCTTKQTEVRKTGSRFMEKLEDETMQQKSFTF